MLRSFSNKSCCSTVTRWLDRNILSILRLDASNMSTNAAIKQYPAMKGGDCSSINDGNVKVGLPVKMALMMASPIPSAIRRQQWSVTTRPRWRLACNIIFVPYGCDGFVTMVGAFVVVLYGGDFAPNPKYST